MHLVQRIVRPSSLLAALAAFGVMLGLGLSLTVGRAEGPGKPVPRTAREASPP